MMDKMHGKIRRLVRLSDASFYFVYFYRKEIAFPILCNQMKRYDIDIMSNLLTCKDETYNIGEYHERRTNREMSN